MKYLVTDQAKFAAYVEGCKQGFSTTDLLAAMTPECEEIGGCFCGAKFYDMDAALEHDCEADGAEQEGVA